MKTKKIHKRVPNRDYKEGQTPFDYTHTTICRCVRQNVTFDDDEVTCRVCLKMMYKRMGNLAVGYQVEIMNTAGEWKMAQVLEVLGNSIVVSPNHKVGVKFEYKLDDPTLRKIV